MVLCFMAEDEEFSSDLLENLLRQEGLLASNSLATSLLLR
jgi:hypothetical protein